MRTLHDADEQLHLVNIQLQHVNDQLCDLIHALDHLVAVLTPPERTDDAS